MGLSSIELPSLGHRLAQDAATIEPRTDIETCPLPKKRLAGESAHITPTIERQWFADNEMDQCSELSSRTSQSVAHSPANLRRLRGDLRGLWDRSFFSILPDDFQVGDRATLRLCAHSPVEDEKLFVDCHDPCLEPPAGRSVPCFFARFAWGKQFF